MKRLLVLLSVILLVSCNTVDKENYFNVPRTLYITFSDAGGDCQGVLEVKEEHFTFLPDSPKGLVVTFDGENGEVSYNGLVFNGAVTDAVRIKAAVTAIKEGKAVLKFDKKRRLTEIEGNNFNIKVHKETIK